MVMYNWEELTTSLKEELTQVECRSRKITNEINTIRSQMESLKIDIVQSCLEEQIRSEARRRGFISITMDKKMISGSILVSINIIPILYPIGRRRLLRQ